LSKGTTVLKNDPTVMLKIYFSLSNEIFAYREHYEQARNKDLQSPSKQKAKIYVQK
jgi:hypothetical protein